MLWLNTTLEVALQSMTSLDGKVHLLTRWSAIDAVNFERCRMKALRSYPGVLVLLLIASAMLVHGLVDYINYEVASPSILAALGCLFSAILLVGVYEFKSFKANRKVIRDSKV